MEFILFGHPNHRNSECRISTLNFLTESDIGRQIAEQCLFLNGNL
jgi:hypothetical protein